MHPWAWWCWALCAAGCISLTTNPWFVLLLSAAVLTVVLARRTDAPWARNLRVYLLLALVVIGVRLFFQVLMGAGGGTTVLFTLPQVQLPGWAAGVRLGGPVMAESLVLSVLESLRLAAMLLAIGAANALANPRRALRSVPPALYELSVAVTISLTVAPQLIESVARVRRARRLRGGPSRGWKAVRGVVIPVMEDAIDRSLALAQGMEVRGFGRTRGTVGRWTTVALLLGAMLATAGIFCLLTVTNPVVPVLLLAAGAVGTWLGLRSGGRVVAATRYRPDPWRRPENDVVACGAIALACGVVLLQLYPLQLTITELAWPPLHPLMLVAGVVLAMPAVLTPVPPRQALARKKAARAAKEHR